MKGQSLGGGRGGEGSHGGLTSMEKGSLNYIHNQYSHTREETQAHREPKAEAKGRFVHGPKEALLYINNTQT